jgi:hypothetical protein
LVARSRGTLAGILAISRDSTSSLAFLLSLPGILLLLLAGLPLLPDLLEFFRSSLGAVRLHSNVGIKVVQGAVCLLATVPTTLIHTLDFFITTSRTLVLLRARDGDKGVDLR